LAHGEALSYPPLRRAIADYIGEQRGVRRTTDQLVVTSGTERSLDLYSGETPARPGRSVWMEDPGYAAVTSLLRAHGAEVIEVLFFQRGEFLHPGMTLDYTLQNPPPGLNAPPGTTCVMNETRRVRFYERSYYDHPAFGVIALVTPARGQRPPGQ
jgi:hypothetical protein